MSFSEMAALAFLLLMLYSFLGWCGEMVYCSLGQRKLCEKRGFLNGPICPIYGHGALLVLLVLDGGCENLAATFFFGALLTSAVEYFTSFVMEKLFHMRWWDYSEIRFNLNGRVCLRNSALFGAACVVLCHGLGPRMTALTVYLVEERNGTLMAGALFLLYGADVVLSVRSAVQIGSRLEKLHLIHEELAQKLERLEAEQEKAVEIQRARLEEALHSARLGVEERREEAIHAIQSRLEPLGSEFSHRLEAARAEAQQRMRAVCEKPDMFEQRLLSSFPSMRSLRHGEALEKLREYMENR